MKALLLIGGQATRLHPLSKYLAKSLMPVCDRELLHYQVSQIAKAGIGQIGLAAGHLVEQLQEYLQGYGGIEFSINLEPEPRGTAGAIAEARDWLSGDSVLVLNADILANIDYGRLIKQHREAGRVATLVGKQVKDPARYGLLNVAGDAITGFTEKPEGELGEGPFYINAGAYVLEPAAYEDIPGGRKVSIERETFPALLEAHGSLTHYAFDGLWHDIGTFESYFEASFALLGKRYIEGEDALWGERSDCAIFKDLVYLNQGARVGKQVDLYHRVIIMRGVSIADGCRLENTIVMPGAHIGEGCKLKDCIVGPNAGIQPGLDASNSLFIEGEQAQAFFPKAAEV